MDRTFLLVNLGIFKPLHSSHAEYSTKTSYFLLRACGLFHQHSPRLQLTSTTAASYRLTFCDQASSSPRPSWLHIMEKPTNPYRRGSRWLIHSHTPPPPPNHRAHRIKRGEVRQIRAEGFIEHCLANPPLQGSLGHQEFSMAITEELSVQDGHGAQVVAVKGRRPRRHASRENLRPLLLSLIPPSEKNVIPTPTSVGCPRGLLITTTATK